MRTAAALTILLLALALAPPAVLAQSNGSIYQVQGATAPLFLMFSVSNRTFIAAILTFGNGGNGRYFAAVGTTDGVTATGQIILPAGFALTHPANTSIQFQLDQPGGATGNFSTVGLETLLRPTSGRVVRVFP